MDLLAHALAKRGIHPLVAQHARLALELGGHVTMGSDGERTLLVYEDAPGYGRMATDTLNGSDTAVRIELLDAAGKVLTSSVVSSIAPRLPARNLL